MELVKTENFNNIYDVIYYYIKEYKSHIKYERFQKELDNNINDLYEKLRAIEYSKDYASCYINVSNTYCFLEIKFKYEHKPIFSYNIKLDANSYDISCFITQEVSYKGAVKYYEILNNIKNIIDNNLDGILVTSNILKAAYLNERNIDDMIYRYFYIENAEDYKYKIPEYCRMMKLKFIELI